MDAGALAKLKCPSCINVTRRRNDDNSPALSSSSPSLHKPAASTLPGKTGKSRIDKTSVSIDNMSALLDQKLVPGSPAMLGLRAALREDLKSMVSDELNKAFAELIKDFTRTTDFIVEELKDLKATIVEKDKQIKHLETRQSALQKEIAAMNNRLNTLEKISRDHNVEVQAVPENRNENVLKIFKEICNTLDAPISDSDIRACRRIAKTNPATSRPRNILVSLNSPRHRDLLLSATHRFNKAHPQDMLSSHHAGVIGESTRIYLSEHLSPELKHLHAATRHFARKNNFKYVWVKFGQVFMRKDGENENSIRVKNLEHLESLQ